MQSDFVTGCSVKHIVFVTLCTRAGHDDNDRKVFLRFFLYKFSRFEFPSPYIDFDLFKEIFYQSISSISIAFYRVLKDHFGKNYWDKSKVF